MPLCMKRIGDAEPKLHRTGGRCDRREFLQNLAGRCRSRNRPRSRRAGDRDMRRLVTRETRIVLLIDLANSPPGFSTDLGDDEDPVQLHYRRTIESTGMSVPLFDTETPARRNFLSSQLSGCECWYLNTLMPVSVPIAAPARTSLAQCWLL